MDVFSRYDREEQQLGLAPLGGNMISLEIAGEAGSVDAALDYMLKLWAIIPASTIEWATVDGNAPQKDEPARARVLMRITERLEHERGRKEGQLS